MKDIVLYCKSYERDFLRLRRLLESIQRFNKDKIFFYISTAESEKNILEKVLLGAGDYLWVSDESIVMANPKVKPTIHLDISGSQAQANIKSEFWRLGICENYVCLDSDCIFIRDFSKANFLNNDTPYTVIFQNKDYFQLSIDRGFKKSIDNLIAEADRVKQIFGRKGPNYYCHCPPFIWSAKVWRSLDQNFLIPRHQTVWDLVTPQRPETLVYLEALLAYKAIELRPVEQLFRVYYYDWQYYILRRLGEKVEKLKENYLGIVYQSNWESELNYGAPRKPLLSRLFKRFKRFLRYLQSYI